MSVQDELDKQRLAAEAKALGVQPWQLEAMRAVPTSLVRDIVADAHKGISQSASLIPDRQREEPRAPSGGTVPIAQPPGVKIIDEMCAAQDRRDRLAAFRQKVHDDWIEHLMSKPDNKVKTEYDPFSRKAMWPEDGDDK